MSGHTLGRHFHSRPLSLTFYDRYLLLLHFSFFCAFVKRYHLHINAAHFLLLVSMWKDISKVVFSALLGYY